MRSLIATIVICAASGGAFGQAPDTVRQVETGKADPASAGVDELVSRLMKRHHIPGVSVAVVRDGKVVLTRSYGLANVELRVPVSEDTVFQLASVTKTFTAA